MKKEHLVIAGVIILAGGLLWGSQEQAKEWEYASFGYAYAAPPNNRAVRWSWTSPGVYAEGASIKELGTKMGITFPVVAAYQRGISSPDYFSVIDWAGSMGWELVTMEAMDAEYTIAAWFKRQK